MGESDRPVSRWGRGQPHRAQRQPKFNHEDQVYVLQSSFFCVVSPGAQSDMKSTVPGEKPNFLCVVWPEAQSDKKSTLLGEKPTHSDEKSTRGKQPSQYWMRNPGSRPSHNR